MKNNTKKNTGGTTLNTGLQKYFPMIRTREEVLAEIQSQPKLSAIFQNWKMEHQDEFLDCVTGAKGVKVLYDAFFKEIMNPETAPERLEEFLSLLLGEPVKIKCILPTDNSRIADESSLLIMDILIELEDGSLANLEAQKAGYMFPGQQFPDNYIHRVCPLIFLNFKSLAVPDIK